MVVTSRAGEGTKTRMEARTAPTGKAMVNIAVEAWKEGRRRHVMPTEYYTYTFIIE